MNTFQTFIAVVVLITFSTPMLATAEQDSVSDVVATAKAAGERDALHHEKGLRAFGLGLGLGVGIGIIGRVATNAIAESRYPKSTHYRKEFTTEPVGTHSHGGSIFGYFSMQPRKHEFMTVPVEIPIDKQIDGYNGIKRAGMILNPLVSLLLSGSIAAAIQSGSPPSAENFVGKSPAYIQAYTEAYKSKVQSLRRTRFIIGSVIGTSCLFIGW